MFANPFVKEPLHSIIRNQVKHPLAGILTIIDTILPEPTKETVTRKNTRVFIDIKDEFFRHLKQRVAPLRAIAKLFLIVYDYDTPYRSAIDWLLEKLVERYGELEKRPENEPDERFWEHSLNVDKAGN